MTLMDDLHRVVSVQGSKAKIVAMQSAYWLYERNPDLSLDEQAEGKAFLEARLLVALLILKTLWDSVLTVTRFYRKRKRRKER